jgi:hypothetical protein
MDLPIMKTLSAILLTLFISTAWAAVPAATPSLKGEVLETVDAGTYTYLRLKTTDGEMWAAVLSAPVKKGARVTIESPMLMTNFESKTLNRKFDKIIFGSLAGTAPTSQRADSMPPHAGASKPAAAPVGRVAKATGPDARTIVEVASQRAQLKGKTVAVRGQVVKFMANVMGKNWVHLQDGSGSAADGTNDLLVTTKQVTKVGDVVVAKGVVRVNADFGYGYIYKFMLEDATLQK